MPLGIPKPVRRGLSKRAQAAQSASSASATAPKDPKKYINVSEVLEEGFKRHNQNVNRPDDLYQEFPDDGLSSSERNRQAKKFIDEHLEQLCEYEFVDKDTGVARKGNYYGRNTMSEVPRQFMRNVIEIVSADAELAVFRQAANNWAIKELIMQKMNTKCRKYRENLSKNKRDDHEQRTRAVGPGRRSNDKRTKGKSSERDVLRNVTRSDESNSEILEDSEYTGRLGQLTSLNADSDGERLLPDSSTVSGGNEEEGGVSFAAYRAKMAFRNANAWSEAKSAVNAVSDIGQREGLREAADGLEFEEGGPVAGSYKERSSSIRQGSPEREESRSQDDDDVKIRMLQAQIDELRQKSRNHEREPRKQGNAARSRNLVPTARSRLRTPPRENSNRYAHTDRDPPAAKKRRLGRSSN